MTNKDVLRLAPVCRAPILGARGAVVRGSCATVWGRSLSSALWLFSASRSLSVWVEYVKSSLNPADSPSRMCPLTDKPACEDGVCVGVPRAFFDIIESKDSLTRARLSIPNSPDVMVEAWPCLEAPPPNKVGR